MNQNQSQPQELTRDELLVRLEETEQQRDQLIAEREAIVSEAKQQTKLLRDAWKRLELERRAAIDELVTTAQTKQPSTAPVATPPLPNPGKAMPSLGRNTTEQFQQLRKSLKQ